MSDYFQRWAYYLRRYHEVPLQVLLRASLRPGDVFVDVGANNGLVSMLAAWRVGPGGRVLAIEPNPVVARQLQWHVEANRLSQVTVLHIGLADVPGEGVLSVPGFDNLGAGTLAPLPSRYGGQTCQTSIVSLRTGDSVCASLPESPLVLKLDIEGLEVRALRGLEATISTRLPMIVCEVNEEMLEMAGSSACELWDYLTERGYLPFEFTVRRAAFRLRHLRLTPITRDQHDLPLDFAWLHPKGPHWTRLERLMGA